MTDPKETFMSAAATEWWPSRFPGVSRKVLRGDTESGESAALSAWSPARRSRRTIIPPERKSSSSKATSGSDAIT